MSQTFNSLESGVTKFGDLYSILNNNLDALRSAFAGTSFPSNPTNPQICVRTDYSPYRVFLYDGSNWNDLTDHLPAFVALQAAVEAAKGSASTLRDYLTVAHNDDGTLKSDAPAGSWWMNDANFVEQITSNQFTTSGDRTNLYVVNRAIQATQTAVEYGYVAESSYDSGSDLTTVTVTGVTLESGLSAISYGQSVNNAPDIGLTDAEVEDIIGGTLNDSGTGTTDLWSADNIATQAALVAAAAPAHYARDVAWSAKGNSTAAERYTLVSPGYLTINVNKSGYVLNSALEFDLSNASNWDDTTTTDWTVASNRAGKDFYVYACTPASGTNPDFILSANSTIPDAIPSGATPTEDNTRKVGGFPCLCADVGTISGHDLSDYVAGDILPQGVWDLNHRPESEPEGMVYDPGTGKWADIYLASVQSGELGSVYDATTADGESAEAFHWYKFDQWFRRVKKRFPFQGEFVALSIGSNQGTNISGSADPGTTGGHSDTAGRRMISNIGCEDCCGALWQWGIEGGATTDVGSSWSDAFDSNDSDVGGQHYEAPNRPLFGGGWGSGSECGSRGSCWCYSPLHLRSTGGARGVAESLKRGQ